MRMRASLISLGGVLLLVWLAFTVVSPSGSNPFVVQVPAAYLSVGQQFQPRLVSLAPLAAAPTDAIQLELRDAAGHRLSRTQVALDPTAIQLAPPLALPHPGSFELRATLGGAAVETIALHALPPADALAGGVLPLAGLGLAPGIGNFLRQHAFAIQDADLSQPTQARLILVEPRLSPAAYTWLWSQVEHGVQALVLAPPPPAANAYWPVAPPLVAPTRACLDDSLDPRLLRGLANDDILHRLLQPPLTYDFAQQAQVNLYHWDGRRLDRPNHRSGYPGCFPLVSYRYGDGWVTLSSLPLLQHFQDARARLYLMNLLQAVARRKPWVPPSPGLAWVLRKRMPQWPAAAPPAAAIYYRPPPTAIESAPVLVPLAGAPGACWPLPATREPGATLTLELGAPATGGTLQLDFGPSPPPPLRLEASSDGRHWTPLPGAPPAATTLPAGPWQSLRLTSTAATPAWRLCQFALQRTAALP